MNFNNINRKTIQAKLFESFEKYPGNIAVEYGGHRVTYRELDRYANDIAGWLLSMGIEKETFIGIAVNDKIALIAIILGIVRAGCVFVPLDCNYPDRRTEAMLLCSDTSYLFTEEPLLEKFKSIRRGLPRRLDIFTINDGFYRVGKSPRPGRHEDKYRLSEAEKTRYTRQMLIDGWGIEGQERLKGTTVFVGGAGGSGSPLIQQLALCGFGTIIICDYDTVELSNLNRQSLHDESRIGMNKALSAKMTVERLNPNIKVIPGQEKITMDNVFDLVGDAEIIFDNVDSLAGKSALCHCAVAKGIPHFISSMIHVNSYACVFHTPYTPCFHCLYDKEKIKDITRARALDGRYNVIPNSVASPALHLATGFAVNEAVKILLGFGKPAYNIYFHFNQYGSAGVLETNGYRQITYPFSEHFRQISRNQGFDWDTGWHGTYLEEIKIEPNPNCPVCGQSKVFAGVQGEEANCDVIDVAGYQETNSRSLSAYRSPMPWGPWPPEASYKPEDKINIYFTSGTTGQPKAVIGKNESLVHFITWEVREFNIDETKRVSQLTSQCHDPFLRDIFVPLCVGGTICVPDSRETILDSRKMIKWLEEARVNLVHCTPGLFKVFASDGFSPGSFAHLEYVLLAGEKIVPRDLGHWYGVMGDRVQLVNVYGPTETTLAKLFYLIRPADIRRDSIPIGRPIPGAKVIILNKALKICGPGEVGEIYIRTPFRSHGYYNDPVLNAEKFIINPFSGDPGDIVYKTGDLGKWNREGQIEFVGREDRQVKIRGFRVELDEIEKRLRDYPGIDGAVVLYRSTGTGNYILCAYYRGEAALLELKAYLREELPDYMVPSFFIKMAVFPLNINGKIDYKALPEPDAVEREDFAAPGNEMEKRVVRIWSEILGIERIGLNDGFLDMGGNSLNAMSLMTRLYKEFGVNLQLAAIFENPTAAELVSLVEAAGTGIYQGIEAVEEREYYPLSSAQMRMYLLREFAGPGDIGYNQPKLLHIKGRLEKERLEGSFKQLIARHDVLRTGFETIAGQPAQKIHDKVSFAIEYYLATEDTEGTEKKEKKRRRKEIHHSSFIIHHLVGQFIRPFDLSRPPLLRVGLGKAAEEEHILVFDIHHIISDGVTTGIFIDEFMKLYKAEALPGLPIQYKDYAVWQQAMLQSAPLKKQESYWLEVFKEEAPVLNLTTDYPRPAVQSFAGSHWSFDVEPRLIRQLETTAREGNATLYMVLLTAYTALLYRYSGQEDIVVGSPIAGRPHADLQGIPGVFINTLAMRNRPAGAKTFEQLLAEVMENAFKAYENQDYPFEELVGKLDLRRDLQRNPLFETLFIMQNIDMTPIRLEGLEIEPYPFDVPTSKFDISLNVLETSQGFLFAVEYCSRLFRQDTVERLSRHFVTLLASAAENPRAAIGQIDLLSPEEKEQLLHRFNDTAGDFPGDRTVHELFEDQAGRTPDNIAVVGNKNKSGETVQLTYKELNKQSDRLAGALKEKGVLAGDIAAIMMRRTVEMITGLLAILKSGAAYLPIDPAFPRERSDYMLKDSNAGILVSEGTEIVSLSELSEEFPTHLTHLTHPSHLCYVIYTSGTTGRPKGVAVKHRNITNFITAMAEKIDFSAGKRILALTTISFDIFVLETLVPLARGLTAVMADETRQTDALLLNRWIETRGVDMLQMTPSRLKILVQDPETARCLDGISELIVGGEAFPRDLYETVKKKFNGRFKLYNVYGPTETTVWSTLADLTGDHGVLTIGKPLLNTEVYIADRHYNPVPRGVAGELCIAGEGTAAGYINNPELTAEKFIMPPAARGSFEKPPLDPAKLLFNHYSPITTHQSPLYKTGDLARWLPDGEIQFLGRVDHQVKIRGFRIEPGEIERHLANHEAIKEAVVIAREDNNNDGYLCAYIVPHTPGVFAAASAYSRELKECLARQLPGYMIPTLFVALEAIPLTASGKLNRRALPAPEISANDNYVPARNPGEEKLVEIWADILAVDSPSVGIDTGFFELGGHSLKATLLLSKIHETFRVRIPMPELFKKPTIRGLAEYIGGAGHTDYIPIVPAEARDYYELSFHQERLWIIRQLDEKNLSYNMPVRIVPAPGVGAADVKKALFKLMERHESLRTAFKEINGTPFQFIDDTAAPPLEVVDISAMAPEEKEAERERIFRETAGISFDFTRAPLFRAVMVRWDTGKYDLVLNMHHIISDGWSMGILEREFTRLLEGYGEGNDFSQSFLAPALQYKDFSEWHNRQVGQPRLREASHSFWREKLKNGVPVLQLPLDFSTGANRRDAAGAAYRCRICGEVKKRLKRLAESERTTLSMVIFTIYNILLAHISGQEDAVCRLIGAGRAHPALREVVGYFTSSILVKTHVDPEEDFIDLLTRVHNDVLETLQHQDYPLEPVLDELKMGFPDIPVSYNMLNLQDFPAAAGTDTEEPEPPPVHLEKAQGVKFDLALLVTEHRDGIELLWNYRKSLFKPETIESIGRIFQDLLSELSEDETE
jgi:fengycin family lipopeptide synthetase D